MSEKLEMWICIKCGMAWAEPRTALEGRGGYSFGSQKSLDRDGTVVFADVLKSCPECGKTAVALKKDNEVADRAIEADSTPERQQEIRAAEEKRKAEIAVDVDSRPGLDLSALLRSDHSGYIGQQR